jgi:hypothetical protein
MDNLTISVVTTHDTNAKILEGNSRGQQTPMQESPKNSFFSGQKLFHLAPLDPDPPGGA